MTPLRIIEVSFGATVGAYMAQEASKTLGLSDTIWVSLITGAVSLGVAFLVTRGTRRDAKTAARESEAARQTAEEARDAALRAGSTGEDNASKLDEVKDHVDGTLTEARELIEVMAQRIEDLGGTRTKTRRPRKKPRPA